MVLELPYRLAGGLARRVLPSIIHAAGKPAG
jgi:hypothetical protein